MRILPAIALLAALAAPAAATAKIDLVTLPGRDATELTIYNSQDLTLVRETRTLSFSKGENQIQFSWANTLIDPTSLQIELKNAAGLAVEDAVYPAGTRDLIVWNIVAEAETSAPVEISYFSSGLSWTADYTIRANRDLTTFSLQEYTTIRNNSGEDFEGAKTRVVVGEVNLLEAIAQLAQRGIQVDADKFKGEVMREVMDARARRRDLRMESMMAKAAPSAAADAIMEAKEIIKQAVSEYYLFSVAGTEDIKNGYGKELPNPAVADVPFDLSYEVDPRKYGNQPVKFYKLKNDTAHKLGEEPLPEGRYYVYSDDGRGGSRFEGTTTSKYVPVGQDIELNLGIDGFVNYEERTMSVRRSDFDTDSYGNIIGWNEIRTVELEIKNGRDRDMPIKLTHYIDGSWEFRDVTDKDYKRVDQSTVRWEFKAPANAKKIVRYEVVIGMGSRQKNV